jgi:hypothetical protein
MAVRISKGLRKGPMSGQRLNSEKFINSHSLSVHDLFDGGLQSLFEFVQQVLLTLGNAELRFAQNCDGSLVRFDALRQEAQCLCRLPLVKFENKPSNDKATHVLSYS